MLNILYEDNSLAVAVKPSGLLSEGNGTGTFPDLLERELLKIRSERQDNSPVKLFTVHRLDRETEGIMVYALNSEAAAKLSEQIQNRSLKKIYTAILCGTPTEPQGHLCDLLYYDRQKNKVFVVDRKRNGVKSAELDYTVLQKSEDEKLCKVRVELLTGRTHQIRVQFASRGTPLCGDRRYGAPAEFGNKLALCATELIFCHPKTNERLEFKISPPDIFSTLI